MLLKIIPVLLSAHALKLHGQSPPAFDVASIRLVEPPYRQALSTLTTSGTRVKMQGYSVLTLMMEAWRLKPYQISLTAVPQQEREIREQIYNIDATTPGDKPPTRDEVRHMIQTLLAERFALLLRREPKQMAVYALVQSSGGATLKTSTLDGSCSAQIDARERYYIRTFSNCALETLLGQVLESVDDRPVVDRTGLNGKYDFQLVSTPVLLQRDQPGEIDIRTALAKLGFRLETRKDTVEIMTITKAGRPTEN